MIRYADLHASGKIAEAVHRVYPKNNIINMIMIYR